MPSTTIRLYRDDDGSVPFLNWLAELERRNRKVYEKCRGSLRRLSQFGHELRRPTADYLRDGVYELRFACLGVNYRILYGFIGKDIALISHGITKEGKVPFREIELTCARLGKFHSDPEMYSVEE
jgi:hypothetical protein